MEWNKVYNKLAENRIEYKRDVFLKDYTTFRIGGESPLLVFPSNAQETSMCIDIAWKNKIPYFILGNGSNILASDDGYNGMLISTKKLDKIYINSNTIECSCGVMLSTLCKRALEKNLSGAEFAWGIPGTVGGAVYMNAGAYGGEIKDILKSVTFFENGEVKTLPVEMLDLSYRHSVFCDSDRIILSAEFEFKEDSNADIKFKMDDFMSRRKEKQPIEFPSAGSTFKRPVGNYAAALIEQCGLKGYRYNGAMVSEKHSGFVINYDNASCKDVINLIKHVKETVKRQTDFDLECEIKFLG